MTKRTFPNPLLAALTLVALLTTAAFSADISITISATGAEFIVFGGNKTTGVISVPEGTKFGTIKPTLFNTTNACFSITKWEDNESPPGEVDDETLLTKAITITPTWSTTGIPDCTPIKLQNIDGSGASATTVRQVLKANDNKLGYGPLGLPATPPTHGTNTCITFKEWSTAASSGAQVTGATTINNAVATAGLFAIWNDPTPGCKEITLDAGTGKFSDGATTTKKNTVNNVLSASDLAPIAQANLPACSTWVEWNTGKSATTGAPEGVEVIPTLDLSGSSKIYAIYAYKPGCFSIGLNLGATGKWDDGSTAGVTEVNVSTNEAGRITTFAPLSIKTNGYTDALCGKIASWNTDSNNPPAGTGKNVDGDFEFDAITNTERKIYATWGRIDGCYTITFNSNTDVTLADGTKMPASAQTSGTATGGTLGAKLPTTGITHTSDACQTFKRWGKELNTDLDVDEVTGTTLLTSQIVLYPKWTPEPNCYTVTFYDGKGASPGKGNPKPIKITKEASGSIVATETLPVYEGACYERNGWAKSYVAAGGTPTIADDAALRALTNIAKNEEFYAVWSTKTTNCAVIEFNTNEGSASKITEVEAKIVSPATTYTVATTSWPARPTRANFTFQYWLDPDGIEVDANTEFPGDTKLRAFWVQNPTPVVKPAMPANSFSIVVNSQNLQILGANKAMPVSIYNLKGKLMLTRTAMPNESISVAHLPKGVYIVKAGSKTAKFAR